MHHADIGPGNSETMASNYDNKSINVHCTRLKGRCHKIQYLSERFYRNSISFLICVSDNSEKLLPVS
jgi:hypothetical protein